MKPGGILINASRGTVVDIDPLAESLRAGKLLGAAIDVVPGEPQTNKDEFTSPLRGLDNVILTPHIGGSTMEAQANIGLEVAESWSSTATTAPPPRPSTSPKWHCPPTPAKRILHVHHNRAWRAVGHQPGVFAQHGLNIAGQYLRTDEKVGYVVMDIDAEASGAGAGELAEIAGTIRCRVLF